MGDIHLSAKVVEESTSADPAFAKSITQSMSERNLHIATINGSLDKLLDKEISPEEYIAIVDHENEKLSSS